MDIEGSIAESFFANNAMWLNAVSVYEQSIGLNRTLASSTPDVLKPIDNNIQPTGQAVSGYRWQRVEPLLDQAARLLDRCVEDRHEWDDYRAKTTLLSLELQEYFQLHRVHEDEIATGAYDVEYKRAVHERVVEEKLLEAKKGARTAISKRCALFSDAEMAAEVAHRKKRAFTGAAPQYEENYRLYEWDQPKRNKMIHAVAEEERSATRDVQYSRFSVDADIATIEGEVTTSSEKVQELSELESWEEKNRQFKARRTMVTKNMMDVKLAMATELGGALNYPARMLPIRERFERSFLHSRERLVAVARGLKAVYNYEPNCGFMAHEISSLDQALLWVREAVVWLAQFGRNDQESTFSFSIRQSLSVQEWNSIVATNSGSFSLGPDLFAGQRYVRLRGLNCFVVESTRSEGHWKMELRLPTTGLYTFNPVGEVRPDQKDLPAIYVGKAGRRTDANTFDFLGTSVLHNASPIGDWTIRVNPPSTAGATIDKVDDIVIELKLVTQ